MKLRFICTFIAMLLAIQNSAIAVTVRDAVYDTSNAGKVVFTHGDHLNKKGITNNCRACHDDIFDLKKKTHFSMADMERGKSCGACHDGKKAFSTDECARCHKVKEINYKVKSTGAVGFSHKSHLEKSAYCNACHPAIFAAGPNRHFTMADMKAGKSCGACHDGKKAFGIDKCASCHPTKEITYEVKETGPTHFSHKNHIGVADCSKCHPKLYSLTQKNRRVGMAAMERGKSCGACHNSRQAFSVKVCSKCHPVKEVVFEDKIIGDVTFSHRFHCGLYACGKCHTKLYQTNRSKVRVGMQEMEQGKSCGSCHDGKVAFSVKGKCSECHQK
jgi:c(7)-type cytochrome triheme protein